MIMFAFNVFIVIASFGFTISSILWDKVEASASGFSFSFAF
jgi:hypothetical protein